MSYKAARYNGFQRTESMYDLYKKFELYGEEGYDFELEEELKEAEFDRKIHNKAKHDALKREF